MADVVSAVAYQQLPTETKEKIDTLAKSYGYNSIEYDWNGTPGSYDLLINGLPASDERFTVDSQPVFIIGTDHNSRLCNFIVSNIVDDFAIEILDKNTAGLTLPEVYQSDLYQFPIIDDYTFQSLTPITFVRKLITEGKLGRNKLIEIVKPANVTKYANDNEFNISITNNSTTYTFTIIFKDDAYNNTTGNTIAATTIAGASFTATEKLNSSQLDNIFPLTQKIFSVVENSGNSFNALKTIYNQNTTEEVKVSRTIVYNKQLLKYVQFLKGDQSVDGYETADGLSWIDVFGLKTEDLPTADYDFVTNPDKDVFLELITSMSLKAFSLPILVNITGAYSKWDSSADVKPTILNNYLVKPYLGTLKAAIDNNEIIIAEDDTGNGTYNYEKELKYPDLSDVFKTYSDTKVVDSYISYNITSSLSPYTLSISPVEVAGNKTGKYKYVAYYPLDADSSKNYTAGMRLTGSFKNYSYTDVIVVGTNSSNGSIIFNEGNQISITKGQTGSFSFKGTKAAKVEFVNNDGGTGVTITAVLDQTSVLPNELGEKYYSTFTGTAIVLIDDSASIGEYVMTCNLLNSDDTVIGTNTFTIYVTKALPKPDILSGTTLQINKDVKTKLAISVTQVTAVEIKNKDQLKLTTAEIKNIEHSTNKNDSDTYDEYNFNIEFKPKGNAGNEEMILILRNSDSSVVVEKSVVLNVYDPIYTSVEEYMRRLDTEAGHVISLSYYEKKGYHLPSVFVTGGEEAASILVAKYPVSQEAVLATSVEETLDNLSKPFRSRVRVYKDSKSADNTGSEGGELHKLINPDALVTVLDNIKTGKLLNGNAHPVLNSASLDTMLANMTDAGYLANNKLELKPLNPTEDLTNSTSEYSLKLTGAKYQLNLTAIRSEDHSFTTVEETKDPFYSQGAIWNTGRKHFEITNNTIAESTRGTILGEMQSEAYETLNKSKVLAFPIVSSSSFNTHNGEANGIVDMFGAGIKVYSDLVYTYEAGIDKLKILDPYTTKVEYDSTTYATRENDFATIAFNENSFMANTDNVSYIGTNENKPDNLITRSVFSNYSYKDFKDGYLMDNVGLPMDNSVMTYPNDVTFKGNAGFVSVPNWQYGRSAYYVDYRQITDNGGTKGYFVTGTVGNGKLLFGNSEEIHNNKLDWAKLYPGNKNIFTGKDSLGFGKATAGNRSRVLLHEGVLYGINKNDRYTDDNLYYNNRLHFLIFDTDRIERNPLVNLSVNNKFIELEETRSATLDITTDGKLSVGVYDKDGISVDLEKLTVTAIKTGTYEFTINSSADNKDTAGSKVYVKVVDLLDPTDLTVDKYDVIGKTDDVITIKVTTNASDISTVMTGAEAVIDSKKKVTADDVTPTIFEVDVRLISVTRPEVSLIISATAPNSKTASIEIPIVISQRIDTKYEVLVKNFAVNTKAELQGTLNTDYLAKKLNLVSSGINLTNLRSVCIWSKQLAGQAWKVNSDYTFSIDFGNSNYSVYTIDFEAQLDQEYEYDGIIPAEKPKAKIENNLNSIVTGTITINVYIGDEAQLRGATLTSNLTDNKAIAGTTYPAAFTSNRPVLVSAEYSVSPSTIATISKVTNVTTTEDQVDIKIADVIENDTSFSLTMTTKYIGNAIEYKTVTINVPSNIQDPAVFEPEEYEVLNDSTVTGTFTVPDHVTVETSVDPDIGDLTVTKE